MTIEAEAQTQTGEEPAAFAEALRQAIARRGVTLVSVQEQLAAQGTTVSLATLSYWRSGARRPDEQSLAIVEAIEIVLELEPFSLVSLVTPAQRLGGLAEPEPIYRGDAQEAVNEVLSYLGAEPATSLREVCSHTVVTVGKTGHLERSVTRSLVQSTTDALIELPLFDSSNVPLEAIPMIESVVGADIVRTYIHPSRLAWGYIARLYEPLQVGKSTYLEIEEQFPPGYVGIREAAHGTARISKELLLWVHFHPDAIPTWCTATTENATDESDSEREAVRVIGGRAHVARHNFGPGRLRLAWGYDTEPGNTPDFGDAPAAGE